MPKDYNASSSSSSSLSISSSIVGKNDRASDRRIVRSLTAHLAAPLQAAFIHAQEILNEQVVDYIDNHKARKFVLPLSSSTSLEIPLLGMMHIPTPRIKKIEVETTIEIDENRRHQRKKKDKKHREPERKRRRRRRNDDTKEKKEKKTRTYTVKICAEDDSANQVSMHRIHTFLAEMIRSL